MAFVGQFSELAADVLFTVEYSVKSAQTAVYSLLNIGKEAMPICKGQHDVRTLVDSLKTMFH